MESLTLFAKQREVSRLKEMFEHSRFPHGLLLSGERGLGKRTLARWCACLMLCENPTDGEPCGCCAACKKVLSREHPDVIYAKGEKYTAEGVRECVTEASRYPNDGDVRVFIFESCSEMTAVHQNILLKAIEEPSKHNRYIFTCENTSAMLPTVLSRLVKIELSDMTAAECAACLAANGMDEQAARDMTALYGTNPGKILDIAVSEERKKIYEIADVIYNAVLCGNEYDGAAAFAQCEKRKTFFAVTAVLYERLSLLLLECKSGKNHNCNIPFERLYGACEILSEYGRLQSTNLNLRLAQTVCCAELFAGLV